MRIESIAVIAFMYLLGGLYIGFTIYICSPYTKVWHSVMAGFLWPLVLISTLWLRYISKD